MKAKAKGADELDRLRAAIGDHSRGGRKCSTCRAPWRKYADQLYREGHGSHVIARVLFDVMGVNVAPTTLENHRIRRHYEQG